MILACAYVDLNPIRAAMAETNKDTDSTSTQKRAEELRSRVSGDGVQVSGKKATQGAKRPARHLAPVDLKERTTKPGPDVRKAGRRCSYKDFLPMPTAQYLPWDVLI